MKTDTGLPFIYGAQYYRAPTPEAECWETDLAKMRQMGFNSVKFWVQWRWSERKEGEYFWDDLDSLMDIAHKNKLMVTLNIILDVAPAWLFQKFPDSVMIDASGKACQSTANICRQIGGYPGPCYNHPGALKARQNFVTAAVKHFAKHPALSMWDVWNEPENNLMTREPDCKTLFCHCEECRKTFIPYLKQKYESLEKLNSVWGRCYADWEEAEIPVQASNISDFIDWREFHLDKLTAEANWRLASVAENDPEHIRYLHVVANSITCFNSVSCVDDFDMAKNCQVFGSTMMNSPFFCAQAVSVAPGKVFYNAECHINFGSTAMHQRIVDMPLFLKEILPQIGWGVRGFLFWQFRAETLGMESPAWGLVRPDGTSRPVADAAERFGRAIEPLAERLMSCQRTVPAVGLWRGRRNELFQFSIGQLKNYAKGLEEYSKALYSLNLPFRTLSSAQILANELNGIKIIIMPDPYFIDEDEAAALDKWLKSGGVLLCEAHLAGYNGSKGRHSRKVPGCGLAESWDLYEEESTSSFHLPLQSSRKNESALSESSGDVAKALSSTGSSGSEFFPLSSSDGVQGFGARRFASIKSSESTTEAVFGKTPIVVSKKIGKGCLFYAGTLLGVAAEKDDSLLKNIIKKAAHHAGAERSGKDEKVHIDFLFDEDGKLAFAVIINSSKEERPCGLPDSVKWKGIFYGGNGSTIPPDSTEFYKAL